MKKIKAHTFKNFPKDVVMDVEVGLSVVSLDDTLTFLIDGNDYEIHLNGSCLMCPYCLQKRRNLWLNEFLWGDHPLICGDCFSRLRKPIRELLLMMDKDTEDYDVQALWLASSHLQTLAIKSSVYCQKQLETGNPEPNLAYVMKTTKDLFVASSLGFAKHKQLIKGSRLLGAKTPELLTRDEPTKREEFSLLQASTLKAINHE